jgi:hypothetical protein
MKKFLFAAASLGLCATLAVAADQPKSCQFTKTDGTIEGGWVVQIPSGSSDYFNVRHSGALAEGPISAISINQADFGGATTYPVVGFYNANTVIDPTGGTPDLSSPLATAAGPPLGGVLFNYEAVDLPNFTAPATFHAVVQFPPGDPGLVGIGADQDGTGDGLNEQPSIPGLNDASAFTLDGYSTAAIQFPGAEWGINALEQPIPNGSSTADDVAPLLRVTNNNSDLTGDAERTTTRAGNDFGLAVFTSDYGNAQGTLWLLFLSFLGTPIKKVGPVLPTLPADETGGDSRDYRFIRVGDVWPTGAGGITVNFVLYAGAPGVTGSVRLSNEVTVQSLADPNVNWGVWDDGTYESGWVVQFPTQSSDYFNVNFGLCPGIQVNGSQLAALDFGTTATQFPRNGVSPDNLGVDVSGNTPDINNPYVDTPAPFPSLTFITTSGALLQYNYAAFTPTTANTHQFTQLPPGDNGLLGIGGDNISSFISGLSGWTLNGYSTAANLVGYANWGQRLLGN